MINIEKLQSDHEEVDNRMVIYARYLVENNQIEQIIYARYLVENNQIEQIIIAPLDIDRRQKYV